MAKILDHWSGRDFEEHVATVMEQTHGRLSREQFQELQKEFHQLNMLATYAVSSWVAMKYPGLEGALRSNSYDNWLAATQ